VPITTFASQSTGVAATASADWRVTAREVAADGSTKAQLEHRDGRRLPVTSPIPGEFNVANAALAILMLVEAGVEPAVAARGVAACPGVPGRMQRVPGKPDDPLVVVDYAHTPDAVETVLQALRPSTKGRLVVVIGAGGDRDSRKRPLMGAAAARFADVVVVTDDNPRSEDPGQIRAAVLAGAKATPGESEIVEVGDRREAIRAGLETAVGPDDTVVVVGKGHEQGQEIEGVVHPFDDRVVLRQLLRERDDQRGDGHQEATR
jgi:UDP-N-acetylmuramoyl-L-alanyl-D-glutamate--2,6-diaminopimelate ligase